MKVYGKLERAQVETVSTLPTGSNAFLSRIVYLDTIDGGNIVGFYQHNGTSWKLIVDSSTVQTLTNKTLSGNTAATLISGSGTLTLNTSGTVTVPNATDTLVGKATTDVLTNKTISGNTAATLISGSGTLTLNTSGTVTVPNATDTLVGKATTDTLTNKTLTGNIAVNLVSGAATVTLPTTTSTLSTLALSETLTNKTLTSPVVNSGTLNTPTVDVAGMTDQGSTPASPSSGTTKFYSKTDGKLYKLTSAGVEQEVGAGASGGTINYISSNPDAETATTGWATYKDAAQSTPVDATGGSPTLTFTRSTSSPLRGTGSFLITTTAANLQGEGASFAFTLSAADQAKVMSISFDYNIASGTYADGDMTVYIYDVTNATVIQPAGYSILNIASTSYGKQIATFQTASNSTSYRLVFHRAVSTSSAMTMKIDNVQLGPQIVQYGAPITDPVAYTPTFTGFGTVSAVNFVSWRDGAYLNIEGTFTTGTVTAVQPKITLGYNGVSANVTSASTLSANQVIGSVAASENSTTFFGIIPLGVASATYITFGAQTSTTQGKTVLSDATVGWGNSHITSVICRVPIAGWSSTVQMSQDTDTRVVAAIISGDPASATSGNPIIVPTVGYDSHGAYSNSTGRYTCPVPGIYKIYGALQSASSATTLTIYKNAVSTALAGNLDSNGEATFCAAVNCVAGDLIDLRPGGTVDATSMTLNVERLSGPSAIAASELVAIQYTGSTTVVAASSVATKLTFTTKSKDTHSAYSSGTFTVPVSGLYHVNASIQGASLAYAAGANNNLTAYKNGSAIWSLQVVVFMAANTQRLYLQGSAYLQCVAGDTIDIYCDQNQAGTNTLTGASQYTYLNIVRVGN